jgi:uncharacterized membrane protein
MADCTSIDNTVQLYAGQCRGGFDFPLLFEESILVLLPIALAVLIAAVRCTSLLQSPVATVSPWLGIAKTVCVPSALSLVCELLLTKLANSPVGRLLLFSTSPWLASGLHQTLRALKLLLPRAR